MHSERLAYKKGTVSSGDVKRYSAIGRRKKRYSAIGRRKIASVPSVDVKNGTVSSGDVKKVQSHQET